MIRHNSDQPNDFRRGLPLAGVFALLTLLNGCASQTAHIASPSPVAPNTLEAAPEATPAGEALDLRVFEREPFDADADPLFRLLVAEFAGQRGQMDIAVERYVESATQLQSLEVAKRATRIAVFARNNEGALKAAKIWVAKAPKDTEARQILAAMEIRAGNADAAIKHLEAVLDADATVEDRQLRMIANLLSREEDKMTALKVMEQLVGRRVNDRDAQKAYALLSIRAGDFNRSEQAMERLFENGEVGTNIVVAYVGFLQRENKTREALVWLEEKLAKQPEANDMRLVYARLLADSERYEQARIQFSIVAAEEPDNSDVLYALGLLNLQANRIDTAESNFKRLKTLEVRADDANFYLAQIAESRENFDRAIEYYGFVSEDGNYFEAQVRVAMILAQNNDVAEAQAHLRSLNPSNEVERMQMVRAEGEMLARHDRLEEAMAVYDRALEEGYDMELLYTRAMLAEKMGRLEILEADLHTIIAREPDNAQALNALGYTLADHTDRYEEAYSYIERAFEIKPNDFYVLDSMGWVLYRLGRLDEAIDFLNRARAIKDDPEVAAHLGEVLWVRGDKEAARSVWDSALKDTPNDPRLLDVIERLTP